MSDINSVPAAEGAAAPAEIPSSYTTLPSSRKLLRSTALAAVVALLLLVTVVLPAEYGVDATGIGRALGLTEMGEIKVQLAKEAAADVAADVAAGATPATVGVTAPRSTPGASPGAPPPRAANAAVGSLPPRSIPNTAVPAVAPPPAASAIAPKTDEASVTLRPNEGKEIKLSMQKGARVNYTWSTDRGVVNYDTHADRTASPAIKYHGYAKGQGKASDTGVLVAAFDGMHGWFWRNRTREPLTLTLRTSGDYRELKRME
ncbi:MAG: hypothetical protein WKF55_07100 [Gemmatimonadaceae bacterium]